jgi:hypothetical protein
VAALETQSNRMNAPTTIAELLIDQFAPTVLLTIKQVSQVTGQAEQAIRNPSLLNIRLY